jgi:hypothetical protein
MIRAIAVRVCLSVCFCLCVRGSLVAQDTTTVSSQTVRVYLDCDYMGCDFDYFRTELTMVNWVRDRQVADVHAELPAADGLSLFRPTRHPVHVRVDLQQRRKSADERRILLLIRPHP